MKTIGEKISIARKNKSLSQSDLAKLVNITPQMVSKWENDISLPDVVMLKRLSEIFEIPVSYFFEEIDTKAAGTEKDVSKKDNNINLSQGLTYGQALYHKREELGLCKKEFANKLNISVYKLAEWEEGLDTPTDHEKALINSVLNVEIESSENYKDYDRQNSTINADTDNFGKQNAFANQNYSQTNAQGSGSAVGGLVCGIIGLVCAVLGWFVCIFSIVSFIFGALAIALGAKGAGDLERNGESQSTATVAIVFGIVVFIISVIFNIILFSISLHF